MKKAVLIVLAIWMAGHANAQLVKDSSSSKRKNELLVGIKLSNVFPVAPSELLYRRNYKNVSLRIGLSGNYRHHVQNFNDEHFTRYNIASSIGIQKNVRITDNFQFYWGADAVYSYGNSLRTDSAYRYSSQTNTVGVSPLVGVRYYYKRFVMGLESSGSLNYRIREDNFSAHRRRESFDFRLMNASKFFIGFTF